MSQVSNIPVIKTGSQNFYLASQFLPEAIRSDIWTLYAFLRFVDDIADSAPLDDQENVFQESGRALASVRQDILIGISAQPVLSAFIDLAKRAGIGQNLFDELFAGLNSDLGSVRYQTLGQLTDYCFQVAGTVGLMLLKIVGLDDFRARSYASDLGIGMQLTNIARDVIEDAGLDRVYLPVEMIDAHSVFLAIDGDSGAQIAVYGAIEKLLEQADQYYRSADRGMGYLPLSCRLSFLAASRLYEAIGQTIKSLGNENYFNFSGKIRTSSVIKSHSLAKALMSILCDPKYSPAFCKGQEEFGVSNGLTKFSKVCYE